MAGEPPNVYVGTIHANAGAGANCTTQCNVIPAPLYTLQTEREAWVLTDEKTASRYAGRMVRVTGSVTNGNRLTITSIQALKQ
jgi:hypothetical protein